MIRLLVSAVLLATVCRCLGAEYDLDGDANIYSYAVRALMELEVQRTDEAIKPEEDDKGTSSVCYEGLGCFDKRSTFKHLKQLPEPPEVVNATFLLYTRKNRIEPQVLDYRRPETLLDSNLDPSKPLKIITHGFGGRSNLTWVWQLKTALLQMHDLNIIVVDWSKGARAPYYIQATVNTELVGAETAALYYVIKDRMGIQEKDLHVIGFSLGAHVVGFVGKRMQKLRGTRPARITGLDPASPLFEDYGGEVHLYKDDADFVDVVHTNADLLLYGGVGIEMPLGDVDFYPNGGKRQPGCGSTIAGAFKDIFGNDRDRTCNHERAVHLFTDSILNPEGCQYLGYRCANYSAFSGAQCMSCGAEGCGRMGYNARGSGTYYLMTKAKQPFCSDLAKLTVHYSKHAVKSYGAIVLTLVGANDVTENVTITENKDEKLLPGGSKTFAITLADGVTPLRSVDALYTRYNGWITKGKETFALAQVTLIDPQGNVIFKTCEDPITLEDSEYKTLNSC